MTKAVFGLCVLLIPMFGTAQTTVTTTGGTTSYLPRFSGKATLGNSQVFDAGTTIGIGVGSTPNTSVRLDIGGGMIVRGNTIVSRVGTATTNKGYPSWGFQFFSSAYNSSSKVEDNPFFTLQSEPTGNNTASPSATFNLLFANNGAASAETGFYINPNGTLHFASAQTFPIAAGPQGPAGPAGPQGPAGGGLASVSHDGNLTGSGTSASPLGLAGSITVTGMVTGVNGVVGLNETNEIGIGVEGVDDTGTGFGVLGLANEAIDGRSGYGVAGEAVEGGVGVYGTGTDYAGVFEGDVYVNGTLSKAGGAFKIDDPIDPANKYLSHSFVESPDMKNIYDGNVVTDGNGTAVVTMPEWFEALNRDFRYQLTTIGQPAQAYVATEISNGTFTIKTDKPNVKVSWQVTGTRQDAWANAHRIPLEQEKAAKDKGRYLHPELFGHAGELSIGELGPLHTKNAGTLPKQAAQQ